MSEVFRLTPTETVTVRTHNADLLEVEALYGPGGSPPPPHLHPAQDEQFRVVEGELEAVVDGHEHHLQAGDSLHVPRGVVHKMWNEGSVPARVTWQTRPAGRTAEWWRALHELGQAHPPGRAGIPSPTRLAVLLREYDDVMRLAVGPAPLVGAALAGLAAVGRRQS